jgi:alcohol dehydrogenase class IV
MALYEMRKFVAPEFIFGVGSRRRVGFYAKNMMARRVFIVSDAGVIAAGWLKDVLDDLAEFGIESVVFKDLTPNPKDYEVMSGAELYARERCDVIVALGGGSVIDCAKAIGVVHTNEIDVREFEGIDKIELPGPPLICIPTTAGTAADVSQFCIIVNSDERYKMAIISKTVVPDVALIDPETTTTMAPYLTACTGLDALTHAIEAYVSTASSPVADVHALEAYGVVWNNFVRRCCLLIGSKPGKTCCWPVCRRGLLFRMPASARCTRWRIRWAAISICRTASATHCSSNMSRGST